MPDSFVSDSSAATRAAGTIRWVPDSTGTTASTNTTEDMFRGAMRAGMKLPALECGTKITG